MKIQPILDSPACEIGNSILISDLHIGIERSYKKEGIRIPTQTKNIRKKINKLAQKKNAEEIIILGDVKNQIPNLSWQERKEIPEFLKKLSKKRRITIVPGNHDGNMDKLLPKNNSDNITIKDARGFVKDDTYLSHDHTWPKKTSYSKSKIIIGHNHPIIVFEDELGRKHNQKCWIKTKLNKDRVEAHYQEKIDWNNPKFIIQPAFNELVGGVPFNGPKENFLGPLFSNGCVDYQKMRANLIDGTYLGKVGRLNKVDFEKK